MFSKKNLLFCFFIIFHTAFSQTENTYLKSAMGLYLNVEKYSPKGHFLFLSSQFFFQENLLQSHALGFELFLHRAWSCGAAIQSPKAQQINMWNPRVWIFHEGKIGKIVFLKQIAWERQKQGYFSQNNLILGTGLSYQHKAWRGAVVLEAQKFYADVPSKRIFDASLWRLEWAYTFKNWSISSFYEQQSRYYFVLAQYNQQNQMILPDRYLNIHQGILGFRVHFFLSAPVFRRSFWY